MISNAEFLYKQRKFIGWLGILLPWLVIISCLFIPNKPLGWDSSMSITYHLTPVLTAGLAIVSVFLMFYEGYDKSDKIVNLISAISALVVAFVPCEAWWVTDIQGHTCENAHIGIFYLKQSVSDIIHTVFACILFLSFLWNILVNFTKGTSDYVVKKRRKILYRVIGILMILLIIARVVAFFTFNFITMWQFECAYLELFGIAWLVKGRALNKLGL